MKVCRFMYVLWITFAILIIFLFVMPKKLTWRKNILAIPVVSYCAWIAHFLIAVKLDFVDFGPTKEVEYPDFFLVTLIPPLLAITYLNYLKNNHYMMYAVIWSVGSFLIEYLLSLSGFMKHYEWRLWYSLPVYLLCYLGLKVVYNKLIKCPSQVSSDK